MTVEGHLRLGKWGCFIGFQGLEENIFTLRAYSRHQW